MTLVSTIGGTDSNSYLTQEEADAYFADSLNADVWTTASAETKAKALVSATRLLDAKYTWHGFRSDSDQKLDWPRSGVVDQDGWTYDTDELPRRLKDATAELALKLLSSTATPFADSATAGISSVTAGSVSVDFDKDDRSKTIPDGVNDLVSRLVAVRRGSTFRQVSLLRT